MPVYNFEDWEVGREKVTRTLKEKCLLTVKVSCTKEVQLLGVRGQKKIPIKTGKDFTVRAKTEGFEKIELRGTGKTLFGFSFSLKELQIGEPLNNEDPPAIPLPQPSNLVSQMHQLSQQEAKRNRMPVMEPDYVFATTRYHLKDDEEELFEEEIQERFELEKKKAEEEKLKEEQKKHSESVLSKPPSDPDPKDPAQNGNPPPSASETPQGSSEPHSAPPLAAE